MQAGLSKEDAHDAMAALNVAYETLMDQSQREKYDRTGYVPAEREKGRR